MPPSLDLHSEPVQRAFALYQDGATLQEAASQAGFSVSTLQKYLRQADIRPRQRQWSTEKIAEAIRLYETGQSMNEVAHRLDAKYTTVRKYLADAGVQIRPNAHYSQGERNPAWRGGRKKTKGYVYLYRPDHPYRTQHNGVSEHRLVMEQVLGRYLLPHEVVDHINGIPDDNRPENLRVFASNAEHLQTTLAGRRPKWSAEGKKRILQAVRNYWQSRQSSDTHPPQTDDVAP